MKIVMLAVTAGVGVLAAAPAHAQMTDATRVTPAASVQWGAAPDALPAGAQAAVLYGDPAKDGAFVMRLKAPKGYHIPPHTHPKPEIVTVISGTARLGMGQTADRAKAQVLPAGSFFALEPGMAHYAFVDEDAVLQLNGVGPWALNYVNPADDPRKKK